MSNDQPPRGGHIPPDYHNQFARMNIGAPSFVPNVQAQAFVPGGFPAHHPGGYGMTL